MADAAGAGGHGGGPIIAHRVHGEVHLHHGDHVHDPARDRLMFMISLLAIGMLTLGANVWRLRSPRTYQFASLTALWAFAALFALAGGYIRFMVLWLVFSGATGWMLWRASRKPMAASTPRLVYTYFRRLYEGASAAAISAYSVFLILLFIPGIAAVLPFWVIDVLMTGMLDGLYFTVLTRDVAEMAAERINLALGFYKKDDDDALSNVPPNVCALCGGELSVGREISIEEGLLALDGEDGEAAAALQQQLQAAMQREPRDASWAARSDVHPLDSASLLQWHASASTGEKLCTLPCQHRFHEFCIRGWTMVGKKHQCPTCTERVDLRSIAGTSIWGRGSVLWTQILDVVRYLVVWFPLILLLMRFVAYEMGNGSPDKLHDLQPPPAALANETAT